MIHLENLTKGRFTELFNSSYIGKSAMSLMSAMTSLCSSSRCFRSWSLSERGAVCEHRTQHTRQPWSVEETLMQAVSCSGKHSGSRIQSCPPEEKTGRVVHVSTGYSLLQSFKFKMACYSEKKVQTKNFIWPFFSNVHRRQNVIQSYQKNIQKYSKGQS